MAWRNGMMFRIGRWANAATLAVTLLVGGCYQDFGPVVVQPSPTVAPTVVSTRIQAGDRINIIVFGEPNLTGIYEVSPSGFLSLPLIGTIRAVGRSRAEIEREITRKYGGFLNQPKITVSVVEFRPFYVFGEAEHPGQYPYYSGLNVLTAITTAGGLTYRANRTTVLIQHPGDTVWREYPMLASVPVLPGDLIRIPERYF